LEQVGGSLGGLAAGLALKSIGHDTTILERNPTPVLEQQGAGIVAGGDTLAFFKRYNRCERPIAVTSRRRQYLDREGNVVHKEEMDQNMTSVSNDKQYNPIQRPRVLTDFRAIVGSRLFSHASKL
jgi:2-polyprenyl-6-methoxyphenol hydroxylase-like FAD-dependent oxidoreductase